MNKCGIITLTDSTVYTDNFDLLSNDDGYIVPFETSISRAALVNGFTSYDIPSGATVVRIQSNASCTNYIDVTIIEPTPTPTPTPGTGEPFTIFNGDPESTSNDACALGPGVGDLTIYMVAPYTIPTVGQILYTNALCTIPWEGAAFDFLWYYIEKDGWYWAVQVKSSNPSVGEILDVVDCLVTPTPTPSITPTHTPSVTPTSTPPVSRIEYNIGSSSYINSTVCCANPVIGTSVYLNSSPPIIGQTVYSTATGSGVYFPGFDFLWYFFVKLPSVHYAIKINGSGIITDIFACAGIPTPTPTPTISVTPSTSATSSNTTVYVTLQGSVLYNITNITVGGLPLNDWGSSMNPGDSDTFYTTQSGYETVVVSLSGSLTGGGAAGGVTLLGPEAYNACVDSGTVTFLNVPINGTSISINYNWGSCPL